MNNISTTIIDTVIKKADALCPDSLVLQDWQPLPQYG